jgi:uncharacterized protein (TIGR02145 family)
MKMKSRIWFCKLIVVGLGIIFIDSCKKKNEVPKVLIASTMTDKDGNVYSSVIIGKQVWLVENLKTTKYNDGKPIQLITDSMEWSLLNTPAYCWYKNDVASKDTYGALYNWFAASSGKLCSIGWHAPSSVELEP